MATLPAEILREASSFPFATLGGFVGPFIDGNSNLYVIINGTGDVVEMWKSTDGGDTWTEQDSAGKPAQLSSTQAEKIQAVQDGTNIHVAFHGRTNVYYSRFHTSDAGAGADTWDEADTSIHTISGNDPTNLSVAIGVRSDGDIIIVYSGDVDNVSAVDYDRLDYRVHQGTGWSDATGSLSTAANAEHDWGLQGVMGESDKFHIFFQRETSGGTKTAHHRSLSSTNTLGTEHDLTNSKVFRSVITGEGGNFTNPVYYDSGGEERIAFAYNDTGLEIWGGYIPDDGTPNYTPGEITETGHEIQFATDYRMALAVLGTTVICLYIGGGTAGADGDIRRADSVNGAAFGASTLELANTMAAASGIRANVLAGTSRLAYSFTDQVTHADSIAYNEIELVTRQQEGYRWRKDDGSESTATWHVAQDTVLGSLSKGTTVRLRLLLNYTGDAPSEQIKLQHRKVGDTDWMDVE